MFSESRRCHFEVIGGMVLTGIEKGSEREKENEKGRGNESVREKTRRKQSVR